ncbi:flavodoxin domain-containing protein [Robertmurraya massiliosenegalensis]|uniref:flavodoxin domain-containing protein n=1 Tax=Robertmurraya TaxID=2837507 RepID=UPI0039A6B99A
MPTILLLFHSLSGNTKKIADCLEMALRENQIQVIKKAMADCTLENIKRFDTIILGSYTWGKGELPKACQRLFEEIADLDLSSKSFAIFGSGDSSHEVFCAAVDLLEARINEKNGHLLTKSLKMELAPTSEADLQQCQHFAEHISQALTQLRHV